jgi:hypothetical protein
LVPSNLNDQIDPLWAPIESIVTGRTAFGPCDPPLPPITFIRSFVASLLGSATVASEPNLSAVGEWISQSDFFRFFCRVLLSLPPAVFVATTTAILSFNRSLDDPRSVTFVPLFLARLIDSIVFPSPPHFSLSQLLDFVHSSVRSILRNAIVVVDALFNLADRLVAHFPLQKLSPYAEVIIFLVVQMHSGSAGRAAIADLFVSRAATLIVLISSQSNSKPFWYGIFVALQAPRAVVMDRFAELADPQDRRFLGEFAAQTIDVGLLAALHTEWDSRLELFRRALQPLPGFPVERFTAIYGDASFGLTRLKYIAACKHYLVSRFLQATFQLPGSTFPAQVAHKTWANRLFYEHQLRSDAAHFTPVGYSLSPRCCPFAPPTVLAPDFFRPDNQGPVQVLSDLLPQDIPKPKGKSLTALFHRSFQELGSLVAAEGCVFERIGIRVPCVSFWYSETVALLTFADIDRRELSLLPADDIAIPFADAVLSGHLGKTAPFLSHLVIIVPISSVMFINKHNTTTIALWTVEAGHFLLRFAWKQVGQLMKEVVRIAKVASSNYPWFNFGTQLASNWDSLDLWSKHQLTTCQFLCIVNCLSGRSFADLNQYPLFPYIIDGFRSSAPSASDVATFLGSFLPSGEILKTSEIGSVLPATVLTLPELAAVNNLSASFWMIRKTLNSPGASEIIDQWARTTFQFHFSRAQSLNSIGPILDGHSPSPSPFHSQKAERLAIGASQRDLSRSVVINVSRRMCRLTISNDLTSKIYYQDSHYVYGYAGLISVSGGGAYFAIDFSFGLTRVYQVIMQGGNPVGTKCVSEFSLGFDQISSVSGRDWLCATASQKVLVLWDIVRGTIHRKMEFEKRISAVAIGESNFCVWVASGETVFLLGLNGFCFAQLQLDEEVTALTPIEGELSAICGTEHGKLNFLNLTVETGVLASEAMESQHHDRIERIVIQREIKRYISVDVAGGVYRWSARGIPEPEMESMVFTSCAVCTNPTHTICQFCNKAICGQCLANHLKGPNCRHCLAFM